MMVIREYEQQEGVSQAVYELMESVYSPVPWSVAQIAEDMVHPHHTYYLAYEKDCLVGFLAVQIVADEMEILQLAVRRDRQGRGIATELLSCLRTWQGSIFLEARVSNHAARNLYERQGFTVIGQRKEYYSNPLEDAMIMKREWNER